MVSDNSAANDKTAPGEASASKSQSKKSTQTKQSASATSEKTINYGGIVSQAWSIVKPKLGLFVGIFFVVAVASYLSNLNGRNVPSEYAMPLFAVNLVGAILSLFLAPGAIKICLAAIDGKSFGFKDLFSEGKYFFRFLLGTILYVLIILGGLILLVVPGIIWSFKYMLWPYLVVDENLSVTDAIKRSGQLTKGYKFKMFVMGLLLSLIAIAGIIALLVGYFIALPVIYLSLTIMYRTIVGKSTGLQAVVTTEPA